jgi:hypothetical protein
MGWMPGAIRVPYSYIGRPRRRKGRGVVFHIAVSNAQNLKPWGGADWHFYVAKDGTVYQYIDTDFMCYASLEANSTMVGVETQGGVIDADREPLTPGQIEGWARIAAYVHKDEGAPLRLMTSSLATERGLGYHRLGVDPWRVAGGQRWSSAYGKICPGAGKIAQMPQVLARAKVLAGETPAPAPRKEKVKMLIVTLIGNPSVFLLSPIGYHFIGSASTVQELRDAGVPTIQLDPTEHKRWMDAQADLSSIARMQQTVSNLAAINQKLGSIDTNLGIIAPHYVPAPEPTPEA